MRALLLCLKRVVFCNALTDEDYAEHIAHLEQKRQALGREILYWNLRKKRLDHLAHLARES